MHPKVGLSFTSQCDGFTECASSIDIDCCHLEKILSVWSKVANDTVHCPYWLVLLDIFASTLGWKIPHSITSNWPILLNARHLSPAEKHLKHALQWLWNSWGDWVGMWCLFGYCKSLHLYYHTCGEGSCIHWASREHSTSTEPSLGDSETVANVSLESINCVLLTISIQPALINKSPTRPPVVDVVLLCVAGSHPCQMYWGRREHSCWEIPRT